MKRTKDTTDSDFDDNLSSENESIISLYELNNSSSEENDSLAEEFDESSINEWIWELDNSHFSTSFNYFHGRAVGSRKTITPMDSFHKFISEDVVKLIIDQTNIYGKPHCVQSGDNSSKWKEVDEDEILAFLGILFIMGFHKLPRIRDYWSQDKNLFTPVVANTMTRDEFYRLFFNIHLVDNSKTSSNNSSNCNKLYKVNDFLDLLRRNFQQNYSPGSCLSIDESIIKFKGRSSIKQYEPLKPTKRGYKIWILSESTTGYVYNFDIYTGKDTERHVRLGEHVVMTLIREIDLRNRQLFFDNYFNSLSLLHELRINNIAATGTIRSDRKYFPTELKKKEKLQRGDYRYVTSNGVSIIKWMDKKEVFVASNYFDPTVVGEISRQNKNGSRQRIPCPLAVIQYNQYMGGVDLSVQKIKSYAIDRKSKRNWVRIFLYFLNMSLVNSYIYYKQASSTKISLLEYISSISTALLGNYSNRKRVGRPMSISNQKRKRIERSVSNTENSEKPQLLAHMPEVVSTRLRCACCSTKERQKRTNVICNFCGIGLCVNNCFLLYHKNYVHQ